MSEEIWKDVPDYEGMYQVSNLGRVKSCERMTRCGIKGYRVVRERILKMRITPNGYYQVTLYKNQKRHGYGVHMLVAMAFFGHKPSRYIIVDHIKEGNKLDNRLENLQIITIRENYEKSYGGFYSKHTGVTWHKGTKKWRAYYICPITKKNHHIGLFDTEEQAYFGRESWIDDYREYRERIDSSWF